MGLFDSAICAETSCQEAVGRNVLCEDGKTRRVVTIVPSHAHPHMSIINEADPDSKSGYFVHNLVLACQIRGLPLPDRDAKDAFTRMCKALDYNEPKNRQERRAIERKIQKQRGWLPRLWTPS